MKKLFSILCFAVFLTACRGGGKDTVNLRFNLKKGDRFEQTMAVQMNTKQEMMGQQVDMLNGMAFTYLFEVVADSGGWKKLASTITHVKVNMSGMGENMQYDSERPTADTAGAADMMGRVFGAMKGASFYFTINDKGEVGQVGGLEDLRRRMMAVFPAADSIQAGAMAFDENGFRENMRQAFAAYPGRPIKTGESWNKKTEMQMQNMKLLSDNTYTLQSVENGRALIRVSSTLKSDGGGQVQGAHMQISGSSAGTVEYDLESGMPLSGSLETKMDMKMKLQQMEMPMSMRMTTTISGKKL